LRPIAIYKIIKIFEGDTNMFKSIQCGPREVKLRYNVKSLLSIRDTAAKVIGTERLDRIKYKPMDGKVPVEIAMNLIGELDVMLWLFGKGLDWKDSGAKPDEAGDLFDAYMDVDEEALDTGERYGEFQMLIGGAIAASRGVDLKKTVAKQKADQEEAEAKQITKLQNDLMKARSEETIMRIKAAALQEENETLRAQLGIGTEPGETALEY
jgi:hypothetical protein